MSRYLMRPVTGERGAVALLTSIIIGILLTIIVTGLVGLMASELRQASNDEQSVIAYYAAQSGVEEGLQYILSNLASGNVSHGCISNSLTSAVGWTCAQISQSGSPEGVLTNPDQTQQIDLAGAPSFDRITLNWDLTPTPPGGFPAGYFNFDPSNVTAPGAAPIELTFVQYQTAPYGSGAAAQSGITTQNLLVYPSTGPADSPTLGSLINNNPAHGHCDPTTLAYHCSVTITNFNTGTNSYIVRLRSRYSGSAYKLNFYNGANPVQVPDGTATVDVTAKAGDVFRRVVYKVPYTNGTISGLDYVLFSDNNDCKNYSIVGGASPSYPCSSP